MKHIFLLFFLSAPMFAQTVTVTVNLKTMFGATSTGAQACFTLTDGAGNPITGSVEVSGLGIVSPIANQCPATNGSGVVSTPMYANDQITRPTGTLYAVAFKTSGRQQTNLYRFLLADGTENLNSKVPITTPPVANSPTGDTAYARLDGGNMPFTGSVTSKSYNSVQQCDQFAGATADVKIAAAITALSSGGTADCRGFGSTTQSLAAQVTVPSGITLIFDPNTVFQASSSSLNPFLVKVNAIIRGLHFDCGNQASYRGSIFTLNDNYRDGNNTEVSGIRISCSGVATGTGAAITASGGSQSVYKVRLQDWDQSGLQYQVSMVPTGNGFINGNIFREMHMTAGGASSAQFHLSTNNGQITGNQCLGCTFEAGSFAAATGILADGTTGSYDQISENLYIGSIFDCTTYMTFSNTTSARNFFLGRADGNFTDSGTAGTNNFWNFTSNVFSNDWTLNLSSGGNLSVVGGLKVKNASDSTQFAIQPSSSALHFFLTGYGELLDMDGGALFPATPGAQNLGKTTNGWGAIVAKETGPPSEASGIDVLWADATAHRWKMGNNNGTSDTVVGAASMDTFTNKSTSAGALVGTVASGTAKMTTSAISAGTCGSTVTVSATGVATTDSISVAFNSSQAGTLQALLNLSYWVTSNSVNFQYCNAGARSVTPAAATLNWRVMR